MGLEMGDEAAGEAQSCRGEVAGEARLRRDCISTQHNMKSGPKNL